jgi:hypothetical protein
MKTEINNAGETCKDSANEVKPRPNGECKVKHEEDGKLCKKGINSEKISTFAKSVLQ